MQSDRLGERDDRRRHHPELGPAVRRHPQGLHRRRQLPLGRPHHHRPSIVSFDTPLDYISFLWGSPDLYNSLTVITNLGNFAFSAAGLGFSVTNGDQSFSQYVQFVAAAGTQITGLKFTNDPSIDAFEVANFSVTAVPEPETYALMLAGFAALGFMGRRRKA